MKRPQSHLLKNDRGQALVEFALTLPMLLVVMFMVTEFGRALYQYNLLSQATREGARVGVVSAESDASTDGEARIDDFLTGTGIDPSDLTTKTVTVVDDYNGTGTKVVVATIEMPFQWILQGDMPTNAGVVASNVSPGGIVLHAETVMKAETF